jgi:hypothetical protein
VVSRNNTEVRYLYGRHAAVGYLVSMSTVLSISDSVTTLNTFANSGQSRLSVVKKKRTGGGSRAKVDYQGGSIDGKGVADGQGDFIAGSRLWLFRDGVHE